MFSTFYSAADLYITDFFHPHVEAGHSEATPLRVYYCQRWVNTVSPTVLKYCLLSENSYGFRRPETEDVQKHRVVVTTLSTSRYLYNLDLPPGTYKSVSLSDSSSGYPSQWK